MNLYQLFQSIFLQNLIQNLISMKQKSKIILANELKERTYSVYPVTERSFPLTVDYYNPLAVLMDAYNCTIYNFYAHHYEDINKDHFIRYAIHSIVPINENDKFGVVVSAIPRKLFRPENIFRAYPSKSSETALSTLYSELALLLSNTIYINTSSDAKYVYKADLYYHTEMINILEKIYHQQMHQLNAQDAYYMSVVIQVLLFNSMKIAVTQDLLNNISPAHFQQWINILYNQPNKNVSFLLPHLLHKNDMFQYLKKKYILTNDVIEDIERNKRYYLTSIGSEYNIPSNIYDDIKERIDRIISYLNRNNIIPSQHLREAFIKSPLKLAIFQYPMFEVLRNMKDKSIPTEQIISEFLDVYSPETPPLDNLYELNASLRRKKRLDINSEAIKIYSYYVSYSYNPSSITDKQSTK